MIILGIDPGLNKIGYGAVETENGLRVIKTGVICPPSHFTFEMKLENSQTWLKGVMSRKKQIIPFLEKQFNK